MKINLFIFGMPRSGTKLLRELLNSSSDIFIPEAESNFFPYLFKKFGSVVDFSKKSIRNEFISDLRNSLFIFYLKTEFNYSVDLEFLESKSGKENLNVILSEMFTKVCSKQNIKFLGDKTPGYLLHTNLLDKEFPNSKFIHIVRDPRDYVLSMRKAWGKNIYLAAFKWNKYIINFQPKKAILSQNLLEIKYEDLISKTETTLREICSFLEIDYNDKMLTPNKAVENKGDTIGQKKVQKDNYNKFIHKLKKNQLIEIEKICFDGMNQYGYKIINFDSIIKSKKPNILKLKYYRLHDIIALTFDAFKIYGFKNGFKKLFYARKQFASKN